MEGFGRHRRVPLGHKDVRGQPLLALQAPQRAYLDLGLRVARPEERMPEYLAKLIPAEIAKWAGPIKTSGVSMD